MVLIRKDRLLVMYPHQLTRLFTENDEPLRASSINERLMMATGSEILDLLRCGATIREYPGSHVARSREARHLEYKAGLGTSSRRGFEQRT